MTEPSDDQLERAVKTWNDHVAKYGRTAFTDHLGALLTKDLDAPVPAESSDDGRTLSDWENTLTPDQYEAALDVAVDEMMETGHFNVFAFTGCLSSTVLADVLSRYLVRRCDEALDPYKLIETIKWAKKGNP